MGNKTPSQPAGLFLKPDLTLVVPYGANYIECHLERHEALALALHLIELAMILSIPVVKAEGNKDAEKYN